MANLMKILKHSSYSIGVAENHSFLRQSDLDEKILENKKLDNHKPLKLDYHKLYYSHFGHE